MGSEAIDATRVDLDGLTLGTAEAVVWKIVRQQDIDQDGFEDPMRIPNSRKIA